MFFRLGLTNARRNLSRSLLSIISMAVAAMVLSGTIFLAAGYPASAYVANRIFAGGDIIILPKVLSLATGQGAGAVSAEATGAQLTFATMPRDWVSEMYAYYPEAYDYGVFMSDGMPWFDLTTITGRLTGLGYGDQIYPYLVLPALETYYDYSTGVTRAGLTVVRGRNIERDLGAFYVQDHILAGRPLSVVDEGRLRAVIDVGRGRTVGYGSPGAFTASFATALALEVPAVTMPADAGEPALFDYSRTATYQFKVVGGYSLPGTVLANGREVNYSTPQVLVPDDTFMAIWAASTGGAPLAVPQVSIMVDSLASVETHVARLQEALPDCTVVSVPSLASAGGARGGLPELWSQWRTDPSTAGVVAGEVNLPAEVKWVSLGLTSLLAALVVAANSLVLLTQRRREIGVLRALGATGSDVMAMVLTEIGLVSSIGAVLGYGIIRVAVVWSQASGQAGLAAIGVSAILDGVIVVSICVGCALLFGMVPAIRSTSIATMEVLRQE